MLTGIEICLIGFDGAFLSQSKVYHAKDQHLQYLTASCLQRQIHALKGRYMAFPRESLGLQSRVDSSMEAASLSEAGGERSRSRKPPFGSDSDTDFRSKATQAS